MTAVSVNMAVRNFFIGSIAHFYDLNGKIQRDTCERMVPIDGNSGKSHIGYRNNAALVC